MDVSLGVIPSGQQPGGLVPFLSIERGFDGIARLTTLVGHLMNRITERGLAILDHVYCDRLTVIRLWISDIRGNGHLDETIQPLRGSRRGRTADHRRSGRWVNLPHPVTLCHHNPQQQPISVDPEQLQVVKLDVFTKKPVVEVAPEQIFYRTLRLSCALSNILKRYLLPKGVNRSALCPKIEVVAALLHIEVDIHIQRAPRLLVARPPEGEPLNGASPV